MVDTYEDFNLRIVADGEGYGVLAQSYAGEASCPFELPGSGAARELAHAAERMLRTIGPEQAIVPAELGGQLFKALLGDSVRRLYDRALGGLSQESGRSLRVRIHIDPGDARLRPLMALPWELLYCADTRSFLNLERRTPVVRSLDALHAAVGRPQSSSLRVLLIMANPVNTEQLDLSAERDAVEKAMKRIGCPEPRVLENATLRDLRPWLRKEDFDIVHFMGHGTFDESSGEGFLLLETSSRQSEPTSGVVLATLLKQGVGPSLVVLNACKSAKSSETRTSSPFASAAAALVGRGIPAVLAMQASVLDEAAITLAEELYQVMAAGDSIEAAVTEARLALYAQSPKTVDWAIPALFVRSAENRMERKEASDQVRPPSPQPSETVERTGFTVNNPGGVRKQVNASGSGITINMGED